MTTTNTQQCPTSANWHQNAAHSPSVRPRRPLFVRVIRNSPATAKPFHPPSQSTTTPTTHNMLTKVPNAGHGSEKQPRRPLIVRIRRNLPQASTTTRPSSSDPRTDRFDTCTRANSIHPTISNSNPCSNIERRNGSRRIVLVRRKSDLPYPKLSQQQHDTIPTERQHLSSHRLSTAIGHSTAPNITATSSGSRCANPVIPGAHYHHSHLPISDNHNNHSTTNDNPRTAPSDSPSSALYKLTDPPAIPAPNIAYSTTECNRSSGSMLLAEVSSRTTTYRRFLHSISARVGPESIWHHRIRKHHISLQTPQYRRAGLRNQSAINDTNSTRTRPNSPTEHVLPLCSVLIGTTHYCPPWPPPYHPTTVLTSHLRSLSTVDLTTTPTVNFIQHRPLRHSPDLLKLSRPTAAATQSRVPYHPACVAYLPTPSTTDKNLLRPP